MSNSYKNVGNLGSEAQFTKGVAGETEFSHVSPSCYVNTTFNGGDIVPIYCGEILPHETISAKCDFVLRQTTLLTPTMGELIVEFFSFFVPNRVVNTSTPYVFGENPNSSWTANEVSFAPLYGQSLGGNTPPVQIPVQSVADYYGFPTQRSIPAAVLQQCNDLKFRGYVEIYNEYFRDQNYQPPIPYSKLNIYEGFLDQSNTTVSVDGFRFTASTVRDTNSLVKNDQPADGSYPFGAAKQAVYGNIKIPVDDLAVNGMRLPSFNGASSFNALGPCLKANKLHDYFTSVLPSPQKGPRVLIPVSFDSNSTLGSQYVDVFSHSYNATSAAIQARVAALRAKGATGDTYFRTVGVPSQADDLGYLTVPLASPVPPSITGNLTLESSYSPGRAPSSYGLAWNISDLEGSNISIDEFRMAAAVQQVYEQLARTGSRYREYVRSFFGLDVDNPFDDVPTYLGKIRRALDVYQTAQTSESSAGSTPQGNLAGFGYTNSSGELFAPYTAYENGYLHIFAVVRHKNVYSTLLTRDNFRRNMLDFYQPPLANISEQPVYLREINPFVAGSNSQPFGYQEAWAEYRFEPDRVTGYMRPGIDGSLAVWNYADPVNYTLTIATGDWLKSNTSEVVDRTVAITSANAPQFRLQMRIDFEKDLPMPTYSVPGLDII
ncbi:MAG: major capsid protein [Chaetfec virus UA24_2285]|nr:MAG: major capsid protein [Chaetfec virus UA24_2285]